MDLNFNFNFQTHLFIGQQDKLTEITHTILQKIFCKNKSCNFCIICKQIEQHKFNNLLWLKPEKQYTLDHIESIFNTVIFSLNENEKYFIIFEKADLLGLNCSNKLLKTIEEPKPGYFFLLLAQKEQSILPTIKSRCMITQFYNIQEKESWSKLSQFFINIKELNSILFLKTIEEINITEQESIELLDYLTSYWMQEYKKDLLEANTINYRKSSDILKILNESIEYPPMPGSSKIFWKNLFMSFKNI